MSSEKKKKKKEKKSQRQQMENLCLHNRHDARDGHDADCKSGAGAAEKSPTSDCDTETARVCAAKPTGYQYNDDQ